MAKRAHASASKQGRLAKARHSAPPAGRLCRVVGFVIAASVVSVALLVLAWREDVIESPRALGFVSALVAGALAALAFATAETPFGIGNGVVPALTGRDVCSAEQSLERRALRWRYAGTDRVLSRAAEDDPESEPSCRDDAIEAQRPVPGTELGEQGVVTLTSRCSRSRSCA